MLRKTVHTGLLLTGALLAVVPAFASADGSIGVELTESPPSVTPATDSTGAGSTDFEVQNVGGIPHELVVIRTDLAADALPVSGDTVDLSQLDVVADSDAFSAGEGGTVTADLTEGSYVLICNVPGHYGLGMRTALTVVGETGDAAATPATGQGVSPQPAASGNAGLAASDDSNQAMAIGLGALAVTVLLGSGVLVRRRIG